MFYFRALLIFALLGTVSWAQDKVSDWEVRTVDGAPELFGKFDKNPSSELTITSGAPRLLGTKKFGENLIAIIYDSGSAGTSTVVTIQYAILYNRKDKSFVGDYPYLYRQEGKSAYKVDQPEWKIKAGELIIKDVNLDLNAKVKL
jgi:hypothetical protein